MKIKSSSVRIEIEDSDTYKFIDCESAMGGFACKLTMLSDTKIYIVKHKNNIFKQLIVVPSARWKEDLKDYGYEILGEL